MTGRHSEDQPLRRVSEELVTYRAYLLGVANRELNPAVHGRVAPSDVVQEAFLEAERLLADEARPVPEAPQRWLRRILLHQIAHAHRAHLGTGKRAAGRECGEVGVTDRPADQPSPSSYVSRDEQAELLRRHMARLPPDTRDLLELRYLHGLPFADIAARLGRSEAAVRSLWARAVDRLRREMGDGGQPL